MQITEIVLGQGEGLCMLPILMGLKLLSFFHTLKTPGKNKLGNSDCIKVKCFVPTFMNIEKALMVNQTVLCHTLLWSEEQCDM